MSADNSEKREKLLNR